MNPFFQSFNRQPSIADQFKNFASAFRGDPKQQVQQLLQSGQMSQKQFEEYSQIANQVSSMFRR